jgi:hypothetical protein
MAKEGVRTINVVCPNCKEECEINEYVNHCDKCGRMFIEYMESISLKDIERKSHHRRTGRDVDQLDG